MNLVKGDSSFLINEITMQIAGGLKLARQLGRSYSLILAGGSSPIPLYHHLSKTISDWDNCIFFLGDERYVAADDPQSNQRMIREHFLSRIAHSPSSVVFPDTKLPMELASKQYHDGIANYLQHHQFIDYAIIGMGEDGHTLSLFPGGEQAESTHHYYLPVSTKPLSRLTGTFLLLEKCQNIAVFAPGKIKFNVFIQSLSPEGSSLPVSKLHSPIFSTYWYLFDE